MLAKAFFDWVQVSFLLLSNGYLVCLPVFLITRVRPTLNSFARRISATSRRVDFSTGKTSYLPVTWEINLKLEVRKELGHEWLKIKKNDEELEELDLNDRILDK